MTQYKKMIELGPPTRYWTLRYEQSHALPKHTLRALNNKLMWEKLLLMNVLIDITI